MDLDTKLELQLEILTLEQNIKQFREEGWNTENLKQRLMICLNKLNALNTADEKIFNPKYIQEKQRQYGV